MVFAAIGRGRTQRGNRWREGLWGWSEREERDEVDKHSSRDEPTGRLHFLRAAEAGQSSEEDGREGGSLSCGWEEFEERPLAR